MRSESDCWLATALPFVPHAARAGLVGTKSNDMTARAPRTAWIVARMWASVDGKDRRGRRWMSTETGKREGKSHGPWPRTMDRPGEAPSREPLGSLHEPGVGGGDRVAAGERDQPDEEHRTGCG